MESEAHNRSNALMAMIEAAAAAPSPDNNQPWLFGIRDNALLIYLDRKRSLPSDEASMFDMTAIGAAVENAVIAASHYECTANVSWCGLPSEEADASQPVAKITVSRGGTPDPLFASIGQRCTSRKPFASDPLDTELLQQMESAISGFPEARVDWITDKGEKLAFGRLIAATDSMRFRTKPFHEELFRQLRFSRQDVESTRDGLDVRTLELPFGVATMLKMLSSWKVMKLVHACRLTALLTQPSKALVAKSAAIAVVSVPTVSAEAFFDGGRAIQRLWLQSTAMGLYMHPLGSLPIFLLQSRPRPEFQRMIEDVRQGISLLLPSLGTGVIQLAFRVGRGEPPSERSLRRPEQEMVLSQTPEQVKIAN